MKELSSLKKKLAAYSAMASAVLALASEKSDGQIVYHDIIPDQYINPDNDYYLDLNNDSIFDFKFHEYFDATDSGYSGDGTERVFALNGNSFLAYPQYGSTYEGQPVALNSSNIIGITNGTYYGNYWKNGNGDLRSFGFGTGSYGGWFNSNGPFAGKSNAYLGFILEEADGNHYGWIRMDNGKKIKDYAYQLIPDSSILAGQQCYKPVISQVGDSVLISTDAPSYQWFLNNSIISGATDQTYFPVPSGAYQVQVTNSYGGTAISDSFFYCNNLPPEISSNHPCICDSPPLQLAVTNADISVQWFFNGAAISGATSSTYNAYNTGDYYGIINSPVCADTSQTFIVSYCPNPPLPTLSRDADTLYSSYQNGNKWYFNYAIIPGATDNKYLMTASGTYQVSVTDSNDCALGLSEPVYFEKCNELLTLSINANPNTDTICEGETIELKSNHPNDPGTNQWYIDDNLISGVTSYHYYPDSTGDYYLIHENYWGCIYTSNTFSLFVINIIPPVVSQLGDTALISSLSVNYQWLLNSSPISGATNQIYFPTQSGAYQVQGTDSNGCASVSDIVFYYATETIESSIDPLIIMSLNHHQLAIQLDPSLNGSELLLYDVLGNLKQQLAVTTNAAIFEVGNFAAGIYFLRVKNNEKQWVKKIFIE